MSEENEARDAQLSFELPRETKEQFEQLATRRGHPPHVVLREFVNTYVAYEGNVRVLRSYLNAGTRRPPHRPPAAPP